MRARYTKEDERAALIWRDLPDAEKSQLPAAENERLRALYCLVMNVDASNARAQRAAAEIDKAAQARDSEFENTRTAYAVMAAEPKPVRACVAGRVPSGLVIIGARPKFKKSWWALQLAIAKSTGGQFMGVKTDQCRAFYIALEDNDRRMRQRLEFFGLDTQTAPDSLHIEYEWPTGLEGCEKIERWLSKFPDTGLVIIDVLQRFRGPADKRASAYDSDYQTMAMLHGITQRHEGLTILVVHHVKKGAVDDPVEALNGTFAIAGAADAYIILRRGEGDQAIAHIDGRDWDSWDHEFAWEFKPQEGWIQVGISAGDALTDTQQEVMRFARDCEYLTPTKLADFRQITKSTAHQALQALVSKGAMRVYAGKYYPNA